MFSFLHPVISGPQTQERERRKGIRLLGVLMFEAIVILAVALYVSSAFAGMPTKVVGRTGASVDVDASGAGSHHQVSGAGANDNRKQGATGAPKLQLTGLDASITRKTPDNPDTVLWDRYDYPHPSASTSQKFETEFDRYDSQVADNFFITDNETWLIDEIDVAGAYSGPGVADSVNVYIYYGTPYSPGSAVISQTNIPYLSGPEPGDFVINLSQPVMLTGSAEGTSYWLSVQANEDYRYNGQWFWRNRQFRGTLYPPHWRNPANGFNTGCVAWEDRGGCGLSGDAYGQVFRLSGTNLGVLPTATGTPPTATNTVAVPSATAFPTAPTTPAVPSPIETHQVPISPTPFATVGSPSPTITPPPACGLQWRRVPGPPTNYTAMYAIKAISADDVWAVGNGDSSAETWHWDGTNWVEVPNPTTSSDELRSIDAVSADDIWAVGDANNFGSIVTLTMHWNGQEWSVVPSPNDLDYNYLTSVTAISADNVWAAGYTTDFSTYDALILHWDGTTWASVPAASTQESVRLSGIDAVAANDIWAVGTGTLYADTTHIEHWDGTQWSIVPSPNRPTFNNRLSAVSALSANDIWAVGQSYQQYGDTQTLTMHWDGAQWSIMPSPDPGPPYGVRELSGVAAFSPTDVWAVGDYSVNTPPYSTPYYGLVLHWDGSAWSVIPNPAQEDPYYSILSGVSALTSEDVWAIGRSVYSYDLVLHYSSPCGSPTPTITPTNTATGTATNTPTPTATSAATNTPTNTNTPAYTPTNTPAVPTVAATTTTCTVQFSDVPPGSTFYQFVHCLACLGLINGYPNGTFRPNNDVTRGQLSKIVSNAAGFSDNQATQMFQDVPVGSTFFQYIGRLASRHFISGYTCGGVGEPCGPGNLPYFRPNNNATRGQISKIVSNAAGFNDPPGSQKFQDVPPGSTFYDYIQRLANRGVMNGYPCGGSGEPCIPPGNLPYFRPNANATRGQTSKIVANTFFPDCRIPVR